MLRSPWSIALAHLILPGVAFGFSWLAIYLARLRPKSPDDWKALRRRHLEGWIATYVALLLGGLVLFLAGGHKDPLGFVWAIGMLSATIGAFVAGGYLHIGLILRSLSN